MIVQTIDGIPFRLKEPFCFDFLSKYGKVFKIFDDQDSGNICFGVQSESEKVFVKFAGAPTARYDGDLQEAVLRLQATLQIYRDLQHPSLIRLIGAESAAGGFAMVFQWADGECMGRMYDDSHARIMALPVDEKLAIFRDILDFGQHVAEKGYVAIDFYDGSIMYNHAAKRTTICDVDFFRKSPCANDMGQMWGSARFMSPEEYELDAVLDETTNVFTLGQMAFSLFTDSDRAAESWPLSRESYRVLMKAISPDRSKRFEKIEQLRRAWSDSL